MVTGQRGEARQGWGSSGWRRGVGQEPTGKGGKVAGGRLEVDQPPNPGTPHAPLSHRTSLTKHKFKAKIIKKVNVTTVEH